MESPMSKKLSYPLLLITALLCIFLLLKPKPFQDPKDYREAVAYCKKIDLKQVEEKIRQNETFFLFTGRETCPYCQRFAPKLAQAVFNTQATVYYLDSEEKDVAAISHFAQEYGIETVPNLSHFKHGEKTSYLTKGSKSSLEEIQIFLNQN